MPERRAGGRKKQRSAQPPNSTANTPDSKPRAADDSMGEEYRLMMELDALETIREEMEERGLNSLADVIDRIRVLNEQLDAMDHGDIETDQL